MTPYLLREEILVIREKWHGQPVPDSYLELSDLLFRAGKIPAAMNLLEHSLGQDQVDLSGAQESLSDSPQGGWLFSRGLEYADACLYEEALACLKQALNLGYDNFEGYYCLAGIETSLGRLEEAERHCRKSLDYNTAFAPALVLLGSITRLEGRFDVSIVALQKALLLTPDCPATHYDLACYHSLSNAKDDALEVLEEALIKGFSDFEWLNRDPDLGNIRPLPGFSLLLQAYSSKKG